MKRVLTAFCAFTIGLGGIAAGVAPVSAAQIAPQPAYGGSTNIEQIQYRNDGSRRWDNGGRRWDNNHRGGNAYYNGHRGYRTYRPGYRRHGDFWFPAAAFLGAAIIGGALNNPPPRRVIGSRHVEWCYDRYRSYRASDNTYQPNSGPRRQCVSPYR